MVSLGGQPRPTVGDPTIQSISGVPSYAYLAPAAASGLVLTSGHGASGVAIGGVLVSGRVLHSETGFLPFNYSGQTIWMAYWVSGSP